MKRQRFFDSTNTDNPQAKRFKYQSDRLYQERLEKPWLRERLFQLIIDHQYYVVSESLPLNNKKILLHCEKAGGNGDVAHTFNFAALISRHLPGYPIKIVIKCPLYDGKVVPQIFPVDQFETQILSYDYYKQEEEFKKNVDDAACVLGIAVPIISPVLSDTYHRSLREYGFGDHPDVKGQKLSMGLAINEEGIHFPSLGKHSFLRNIITPWFKKALSINNDEEEMQYRNTRKLYHLYIRGWAEQIIGLYCAAGIEKENQKDLDLFLPLQRSINELIEWGALQLEYLAEQGVGQIIKVKPDAQEEITVGTGAGKTIRILSGSIAKADMEIVEQYSEPLFGCCGDMSFSAAVANGKLPLDSDENGLRMRHLNAWGKIISAQGLHDLKKFFDTLIRQYNKFAEIERKHIPKRVCWHQPEPSVDLSNPHSVRRLSMPEIAPLLPGYANEIIELYLKTKVVEEARKSNQDLVENYNIESRFMSIVYRGLILSNYPELIEFEKTLQSQFIKGEITEAEIVSSFHEEIKKIADRVNTPSVPTL